MSSLLEKLRIKKRQKIQTAREFVDMAISTEAEGRGDDVDVDRLDVALAELGNDDAEILADPDGWFSSQVERQAEIDQLRQIVGGKDGAVAAFKKASTAAREFKQDAEVQIAELQAGCREAEQVVAEARRRVDEIAEATQRLRQLEPAEHREGRMALKEDCNRLRRLKQDVEQQRATAESDLRNVPQGKTKEHRERYVESRKQIIARADERLPQIEEELAAAMARFEQAEAEIVGAG